MSSQAKVLLIGATGQVGSACHESLAQAGYNVIALSRCELDMTALDKIAGAVAQYDPAIVVNATAYTAVDKAESEADLADTINHLAVKRLAEVCVSRSIPLIHLSTDYVFDGAGSEPYTEDSLVGPQSVYGKTKCLGELAVQSTMSDYLILRTSWVFGFQGNNFVKTMLRLAKERDELAVVADQYGCPTYAGDIADVITIFANRYLLQQPISWGVYHCVCSGRVSWHDFAVSIFNKAHALGVIESMPIVRPIATSDYPTPAKRPKNSTLDNHKLERVLGYPMPSWEIGLSYLLGTFLDIRR
ncbi:dTDP-4-dehydrorhamnose reductase [Eionea flava]